MVAAPPLGMGCNTNVTMDARELRPKIAIAHSSRISSSTPTPRAPYTTVMGVWMLTGAVLQSNPDIIIIIIMPDAHLQAMICQRELVDNAFTLSRESTQVTKLDKNECSWLGLWIPFSGEMLTISRVLLSCRPHTCRVPWPL